MITIEPNRSALLIMDLQSNIVAMLGAISTSGGILSTVRHGADADYRLIVVKDCCADFDEEVHHVFTEKVLVRQAAVISASEAIAALQNDRTV